MINKHNTHMMIPATDNTSNIEVAPVWQENEADTLALICHPHPLFDGTMHNKVVTTVARQCVNDGMHTLRFNFRGVGASEGEHDNGIGEIDDALTVLNWALQQRPVSRLWLAGFSFGGYIAAQLANRLINTEHHIKMNKLTLIAPAVASYGVTDYDVSGLTLPKNTHVIYGSADEVIAPAAIAQFAEDYKLTQTILADASHFFHGRLVELRQYL